MSNNELNAFEKFVLSAPKPLVIGSAVAVGLVIGLGLGSLQAYLFMLAWNYVVPVTFHGPSIDFGRSFLLLFILGVVLGSFRRQE